MATIRPGGSLKLNGKPHNVAAVDADSRLVTLLGDDSILKPGMNFLETQLALFRFWNEEQKLSAFAEPYKKSFAIIAAIDDYDRVKDPAKRGPTGYDMRKRAEELRAVLLDQGFPAAHIISLYDEQATAKGLTAFSAPLQFCKRLA